jgi:uncharacterized protein YecT (DUF1311 family)
MSYALRPLGVVLLGFGLFGCAQQPAVTLSPEAAVRACEAPTALALRSRDSSYQSVVLEPAATSRVERRPFNVGSQPMSMVVAGRATARAGAAVNEVDYLCLIGPSGEALFVDVQPQGGAEILAECTAPARAASTRRTCLEDLFRKAERGLAEAEGSAVKRARAARPGASRPEIDEPVATSIGAWRVYRDAECTRQSEASPAPSVEVYEACRVELTRQRVQELGG